MLPPPIPKSQCASEHVNIDLQVQKSPNNFPPGCFWNKYARKVELFWLAYIRSVALISIDNKLLL